VGAVGQSRPSFRTGYGDVAIQEPLGASRISGPRYLQPAGFVLAPDGSLKAAVYATSAIGRMLAKDVVGFVGYLKSVAAKAAAE